MLDIATLYLCLLMVMLASAATMSVVWFNNPENSSAGYWTLSYLLGVGAGGILFLWTGFLGPHVVLFSSTAIFASYWCFWAGFRSFNNRPVRLSLFFLVTGSYYLLTFYDASFYLDLNKSTAVHSSYIGLITFANAYEIYTGKGNKQLPIVVPATIILVLHALFRVGHIYFTLFEPSPVVNGRLDALWWKLFLLEIFLNTTLMAISTVIMIKDRSEQRHRVASETDSLTGIANRRAFVDRAEAMLIDPLPNVTFAVLDIDHFKQVNDSFGHDAGDKVLRDLTRSMKAMLPSSCLFGRLGGEEFALLFPSQGLNAIGVLERLRSNIEQGEIYYNDHCIQLTMSIGVATVEIAGAQFDDLFTAADCALYLAKQEGRNRIKLYQPSQRLNGLLALGEQAASDTIDANSALYPAMNAQDAAGASLRAS